MFYKTSRPKTNALSSFFVLEIFQQFLLKIFNKIKNILRFINYKFQVGAIWSYCPHQAGPNGEEEIWLSTLIGCNRLWSSWFHVVSDIRIKEISFGSALKTKISTTKDNIGTLYCTAFKIYLLPPNNTLCCT